MIVGGTDARLLARYTVVAFSFAVRLAIAAVSWIGTNPELSAWELIESTTFTVV